MQLIDFHTHKNYNKKVKNIIPVRTYLIEDYANNQIDTNLYFTIGLHPWEVLEFDINFAEQIIIKLCKHHNCLAIGEIGLDKLKPNFDLQTKLFKHQIQLAISLNKPIILHIVKAYNELLTILNLQKITLPIAIHGFSGSPELAKQLTSRKIYLSFGKNLFRSKKTQNALVFTDLDFVFLETDVFDYDIKEIYNFAAKLLNIQIDELAKRISANFRKFFGKMV